MRRYEVEVTQSVTTHIVVEAEHWTDAETMAIKAVSRGHVGSWEGDSNTVARTVLLEDEYQKGGKYYDEDTERGVVQE